MQHVSDGYRQAMQLPIRNRGYIRVLLAAYNPNTQNTAYYDGGSSILWYGDPANLFQGVPSGQHYATLERNWTRVDGTMYFAPDAPGASFETIDSSGVITQNCTNSATITVAYPADPDLTDITLDFAGDSQAGTAPTTLSFVFSNGVTKTALTDGKGRFKIKGENLRNTTGFTVTTSGGSSQSRVRLDAIYFGRVFEFSNDEVKDSSVTQHASPLSEECPTIDAMIKVADYDDFLNPDNPDSAVRFFQQGQMMYVSYGYELITPDYATENQSAVEWVPGWKLELDRWDYQNNQATLFGVDSLRHLTALYKNGQYDPNIYFNGVVGDVRLDAGLLSSAVDMSNWIGYGLRANGAIVPVVSHREAFQVLANTTVSTLLIDRKGKIIFRNYPSLADIVPDDFEIKTDDLYAYARMAYPSQVKDINIAAGYWYTNAEAAEPVNITQTFVTGASYVFSWSDPVYVTSVTFNGDSLYSAGFQQDYLGTREIKVTVTGGTTTGTLVVSGEKLHWQDWPIHFDLENTGYTESWNSPVGFTSAKLTSLISQRMLIDNYLNTPFYTGETRGFPELDAGDVIYLEDKFRPNLRLWLTDVSLRFNGAFRGTFTGRWVGDDSGVE